MANNTHEEKFILTLALNSQDLVRQYENTLSKLKKQNLQLFSDDNGEGAKEFAKWEKEFSRIQDKTKKALEDTQSWFNNPTSSGAESLERSYKQIEKAAKKFENNIQTFLTDNNGKMKGLFSTDSAKTTIKVLNETERDVRNLAKELGNAQKQRLSDLGFNKEEVKSIQKQVEEGESLNTVIKKELELRQSIYNENKKNEEVLKQQREDKALEQIGGTFFPRDSISKITERLGNSKQEKEIIKVLNDTLKKYASQNKNVDRAYAEALNEINNQYFPIGSGSTGPFAGLTNGKENAQIESFLKYSFLTQAKSKMETYQTVFNSFQQDMSKAERLTQQAAKQVQLLTESSDALRTDAPSDLGKDLQKFLVTCEELNREIQSILYQINLEKTSIREGNAGVGSKSFSSEAQDLTSKTANVHEKIEDYTEKTIDASASAQNLTQNMHNLDEETKSSKKTFDNMTKSINSSKKATKEMASSYSVSDISNKQISNALDFAMVGLGQWLQPGQIIQSMVASLSAAVQQVKTLDSSFASIAMVTNYSMKEMWGTYEQYSSMAIELGQSIQSVVDASALYYQQGLNSVEVMELTEQTMKLATLGGIDFSQATSEITAALRSFNMEMDEANTVVDVYSNLAANAAATVEDIATAMTATASIAANAGMSYENTAAYLAKIIETTQESASSIGTSLKTIIANFTQMTTNVSNDEADAELSINSTDEALQSVGISLRDAQGQIKNLDTVIDELGNSWNNLDRNTQRYLATTIAGTRQQSRLIALLDDYDRTLELEAEATDSAGKSDAQFSKYTDTLAYSSQKLSTEMEELKQKFVTDNVMSSIYKGLSSLVTGLNNLPTGAIAALALGIAVLGKNILTSILTPIKESTQAWREMSKELKEKHQISVEVKNADKSLKDIQNFIQEAQIYATQHAIRIPTEIEGQNFTSDFWQEKKTAELSSLKAQKEQTLGYGKERIEEERAKENFETVDKLQSKMKSATVAFDEAIEELTNSISEGISSGRHQNIREGQEGAFQLSQNKIEELYREEKNIASILQDSKIVLTAQQRESYTSTQTQLRNSIKQLEEEEKKLTIQPFLPTEEIFAPSRQESSKTFTEQLDKIVVPEVRHEFMAFSNKYDEIFGQALNNIYINDETAINETIQGLINPLKNMALVTEEDWSNTRLAQELIREFDKIFDPNTEGSLGSIVHGLSPTGDLTEEVISELQSATTNLYDRLVSNCKALIDSSAEIDKEVFSNDFLEEYANLLDLARIKANHVYEDFDTGGNVFNAKMKDTKELVQKNAEEIDAKMEELATARREDDISAIEKLQEEIAELDKQTVDALNGLQSYVHSTGYKALQGTGWKINENILNPIDTVKAAFSTTQSQDKKSTSQSSATAADSSSSQKKDNSKVEKDLKKNVEKINSSTSSQFFTNMGTAAKQEIPKIIALASSLFAELAGGAKASTVACTGLVTILTTTIPQVMQKIPSIVKSITLAKSELSAGESTFNAVTSVLKGSLGPLGAVKLGMVGLTVAITAVTAAYNAWKTEQLDYKIDALTEELSVLDDAICKVNNDMQEVKDSSDNFSDALETYQKLSKKGYLTSDEEDDYKDMVDLFMDSYPELVREYDSVTGTLTLWTKETEKQAEQLEEEARQAQILSSSLQLADVYMSATLDKYEELYEGYSSTTYDVAGESFQALYTLMDGLYSDQTQGEKAVLAAEMYEASDEITSGAYLSSEDQQAFNKLYNSQGKKFKKLTKDKNVKNLLYSLGITSEEDWDVYKDIEDEEWYEEAIYALEETYTTDQYLQGQIDNVLAYNEEQAELFDLLMQNFNDISLAEARDAREQLKQIYGEEDAESFLTQALGTSDYQSLDVLNNKITYFFQDLETMSSLSMGTLSLISDNIDSFFSEDFSYRGIRNYLQKVEGLNLSMDELSAVLSFDWLFYDSSFDAYDPFVEALTAAGMSNSDAKDLYYTILQLQEQSGVYNFKINTSVGITSNLNDFREKVEESLGTIDVTLNIVDASFEGNITVSDLNDYIDNILESDFNTANWWEMFSFDEEGKVQIDYDVMAQVPQEDYENEFMLLEGSRRDMYQGILSLEQELANTNESDSDYDALLTQYEEAIAAYNDVDWDTILKYVNFSYLSDYYNKLEEEEESFEDTTEELADAEEALSDALEELKEAIDALNEVLYGTSNRASSLDVLYNYTTAIDTYAARASRLLDDFDTSQDKNETVNSWAQYAEAQHSTMAEQKAEQQVIQQGLNELTSWFNTATSTYEATYEAEDENGVMQTISSQVQIKYSDYVNLDESTGKMQVDQQLLNQAQFNDEFKNLLEQNVENYNSYADQLKEIDDSISEEEKEMQDKRVEVLSNYGQLESNVADVLKSQYQDEVDALKEKYSSMKEADDDYLEALQDAISKQRDLRNLENSYEDVAKQERKLSLMERDTSGARRTEVLEAQEDLEESRQDLLDEAVDAILDNMEEQNNDLSEMRDIELEIKEAILDDNAYWNQMAESIVKNFSSVEDYAEWMMNNSSDYLEATSTQQETLLIQYMEDGTAIIQRWAIEQNSTIEEYCTVTGAEVQELIETTSEAFTSETERSFNEVTDSVKESIEDAIESVKSAQESVDDARKSLEEIQQAYEDASIALDKFRAYVEKLTETLHYSTDYVEGEDFYYAKDYQVESEHSSGTPSWQEKTVLGEIIKSYGYTSSADRDADHIYMLLQLRSGKSLYVGPLTNSDFGNVRAMTEEIYSTQKSGTDLNVASMAPVMGNNYSDEELNNFSQLTYAFASGGLVDFTGPAWVDGSKSKPEAFLSAEDTARIGRAADIFADIPLLNSSSVENFNDNVSYGDTSIEINLNIDSIDSNIDIEYMLDRMKNEIVNVATPERSNVILHKNYK